MKSLWRFVFSQKVAAWIIYGLYGYHKSEMRVMLIDRIFRYYNGVLYRYVIGGVFMDELKEKTNVLVELSEFETKNITPLFWKYSVFALAGLMFQAASVVADGIFVGKGVGPMGLATIGIIAPLWTMNVALFGLFGIGGATIAAMKLGEGDEKGARKAYGSILSFSFLAGIMITAVFLVGMDPILSFLGATEEILPFARQYAYPYILGAPICIAGSVSYYFARVDERPKAAAVAYIAPAIIAIVLEYLLVIKMGWGMAGAAICWVVCVGLALLLVPYMQVVSTKMKLSVSDLKIDMSIIKTAIKIGFAYFAIQICTTVTTILINNLIITYGGSELEIAAFAILNAYIMYIVMLVTTSFIMGLQPIASFNIGVKNFARVAQLIKTALTHSTAALIAVTILVFLFAEQIISFFVGPDPVIVETTAAIMKVYMLLFALGNISQITAGYYMAVEKNGLAILNGISRIIIFAVPLLMVFPRIYGLKGIWIAQPGADFLSALLAIVLVSREYKSLMKKENA
jgi:putative MATE family efflux protein